MTVIDWASLQHAYGSAKDVPRLLAAAHTAPAPEDYRAEPWFSLWSALCHQDDIYPASYAAVPGLLTIAKTRNDAAACEAAFLAASIELRRRAPGAPMMPSALAGPYNEACAGAQAWLPRLRAIEGRPDDPRRLDITEAVFSGRFAAAYQLLGEDEPSDQA